MPAAETSLALLPLEQRLDQAPSYLKQVVEVSRTMLDLKRLWLFGSRARGDHRPRSDVDLGFELDSDRNWSRFVFDSDEHIRSLLELDLINMNRCQPSLRQVIEREGIVLYERPAQR